MYIQNWDASVTGQVKKVTVSRDNDFSICGNGASKHSIVVRVGCSRIRQGRCVNELCRVRQSCGGFRLATA